MKVIFILLFVILIASVYSINIDTETYITKSYASLYFTKVFKDSIFVYTGVMLT